MRSRQALLVAPLLSLVLSASSEASAQDSAAYKANEGFKFGIGPLILFPTDGGPLGGGLNLDARYGIGAGPTVLAPGGRALGYFQSGRFTGALMPTFRVTLPVGPLAPFIVGGLGGGWISNPSEGGLAVLAGGGLMIHFGSILAIGAEVTYQTITSTEFHNVALGPAIQIF